MKRRSRVSSKSYFTTYLDTSPSKRRSLRRKVVTYNVSGASSSTMGSTTGNRLEQMARSTSPDLELSSDMDLTFHSFDEDRAVQGPSYSDRQRKAAEHWSEIRSQLQQVVVETRVPPTDSKCIICEELAVVVCADCGSRAFFCEDHVEQVHSSTNFFHRPQTWENGYLHPYVFKQPRSLPLLTHCTCLPSAVQSKEVICVDEKGFQHKVAVTFCACEPEAVTLVRHSMWPATPKNPTLAFHQDLLLWLESLVLEGCIGVDAFCRALDCKRGKCISSQFRNTYPAIIAAFEEFRFNRHQLDSLRFLSSELDTSTKCPACPKERAQKQISFDGVYGLCRKKSSGVSVRPPLFAGTFFEDQESVDQFVSSYEAGSHMSDKGCHEFLAGDALRSKSRYAALDETAVFGSICRHHFPQRFFSMKHGERFAYPVYLLQKLKEDMGDQQLLLFYDVACSFEAHLKNRGRTDLLRNTTLAVPIFHVYGHSAFCQLTYSPRVLSDCGLTDGEATERLWSYLRRFAKSTKEMKPSHRVDVLTSALLHYASKVRSNIGSSLCKRIKHAKEVKYKSERELSRLMASNGTLTDAAVKELAETQHDILSLRSPSYGQRHKQFQNILVIARERKYLLSTKSRYADGQSIAARLAKKIASSTSTLKRAISRYNSMEPDTLEGNAYCLPRCLHFDVVKNLEELSSLEVSSLSVSGPVSDVPITLWTKVVREMNLIKRATEEEETVGREFEAVERNMKEEHSIILRHLSTVEQSSSYSTFFRDGCVNLLKTKLLQCEVSILHFSKTVCNYHQVILPSLHILVCDNQSPDFFNFYLPQSHSFSIVDTGVSESDSDEPDSDDGH